MAARSKLRERQRREMPAGGDRCAHLARPMRLDHRRAGVVHTDNHRGRGALARDSLDDLRRRAVPLPQPADIRRADQAQQPSRAKRVDRSAWKRPGLVDLGRRWGDDIADYTIEFAEVTLRLHDSHTHSCSMFASRHSTCRPEGEYRHYDQTTHRLARAYKEITKILTPGAGCNATGTLQIEDAWCVL